MAELLVAPSASGRAEPDAKTETAKHPDEPQG
jgi:hypothetical protein